MTTCTHCGHESAVTHSDCARCGAALPVVAPVAPDLDSTLNQSADGFTRRRSDLLEELPDSHATQAISDANPSPPQAFLGWEGGQADAVSDRLPVYLRSDFSEAQPGPVLPPPTFRPPATFVPPSTQAVNTMALISFIGSLVAFLLTFIATVLGLLGAVAAVVLGHVAMTKLGSSGERGRGFALAGLVIGYSTILLSLILVVVLLTIF